MTKAELLKRIKHNIKWGDGKDNVEQILDALAKVAGEALAKGEDVPLPGLGKLEARARAAAGQPQQLRLF